MARPPRRIPTTVSAPIEPGPIPTNGPDPEGAEPYRDRRRIVLAVGGMLALQWVLAVSSLVRENPTIDEVIHLPAGITYWQKGTFKLYHHNPPLLRMIAALPVARSVDLKPLYRDPSWASDYPNKAAFAHRFMWEQSGVFFEIFTRARLMMPGFLVLGGLVVFAWSKRLYGVEGGLLSLALWTACPNVLAHGRLLTTDLGATALGVGATYLFWRYLDRRTWGRAALAGLALGIAQLSKFSMILLYGLWPVLWTLSEIAHRDRAGRAIRHLNATAQGIAIVAISVLAIDLGYGFEGVGLPLGRFEFASDTLTDPVPKGTPRPELESNPLLSIAWSERINRFRGTSLEDLPTPLPKHYVLGFDEQKLDAEGIPRHWVDSAATDPDETIGYPVYLDGELQQTGWWDYYLRALLYKTPEGTLGLVGLSFVLLVASRRSRASWADELTVLAVPIAVIGAMSFGTDINIGLRYVLPMFPYIFIGAGKVMPWAIGLGEKARRVALVGVGLAILASAGAVFSVHPHHLAYFNWASGGPDRGSEHLIDSNLDWGQDLVNLRDWWQANAPDEPIGLAYFGQIHPGIFSLREEPFDWFLPASRPGRLASPGTLAAILPPGHQRGGPFARPRAGLYAVSASLVRGLPWRVYDPSRLTYWEAKRDAFSYFQELEPIAKIGYSIFVYRVTPDQAEALARDWELADLGGLRGPP